MELRKAIRERRSIRCYKKDDVDNEKILEILKYGQMAPSAGNLQARDFIVIKKPELKQKIARAASQDFIKQASIIIVVCANKTRSGKKYGERGRKLYSIQDADAATQNMLLMIHSMGLSSCWIGAFDEEEVKKILEIPENIRPITILPIGYPNEDPEAPNRKNLEEIIHREKW